jgi:hypothetical protein
MEGRVFCEVCGAEIRVRDAEAFVGWTHSIARRAVLCWQHRRVRRYADSHRLLYDPRTGERK